MTRPVVLLDVDGVLNALNPTGSFQEAECAGYRIRYKPEVVQRLGLLRADIVWLTTWEMTTMANHWIAPLFGWDPLPTLHPTVKDWRTSAWWKGPVAKRFLEPEPRPFIWFDDDLKCAGTTTDWVKYYTERHLLISPNSYNGLDLGTLGIVEDFISRCEDPLAPA